MEYKRELQQVIYDILLLQIESGAYRYRENLPTIESAARFFHVSVDTVRAVYLRLKREGYISLSKNVGARVIVQRNQQMLPEHIQSFFLCRKDALIDLCISMKPLFTHAQRIGLKNASPETMERMERFSQTHGKQEPPYAIWQCLEQNFAPLGNRLLIRLNWQIYMFLYAPVFSISGCIEYLESEKSFEQEICSLWQREEWQALDDRINCSYDRFSAAIHRFFQERIVIPPSKHSVSFCWDAYRNPSQRCYSLAMELLVDINRGIYPVGSFLPSAERLSSEKRVSVSTVRRAVVLLGSIGAIKSSRPLGACVLPLDEGFDNCDFTQPVIKRQLLDVAESLQILSLSCRAVSELTLAVLDSESLLGWRQELERLRRMQRYEVLGYGILSLIAKSAPFQAVRTIYSELLRLLFWGNPLRRMGSDRETLNVAYVPYLNKLIECLEELDIMQFSACLEALITCELRKTVGYLAQLGIPEVEDILVPDGII